MGVEESYSSVDVYGGYVVGDVAAAVAANVYEAAASASD